MVATRIDPFCRFGLPSAGFFWPWGANMSLADGWYFRFWILLAIALILRIGLAFEVQRRVSQTPGRLCLIEGDAEGYWELAGKMAAFQTYSIHSPPRYLLRMPGFPLLLALPRFLFGDRPFVARLLLACVGTLACALTYVLGKELVSSSVGFWAMAYTTLSPTMLIFSVMFLSETAFAAALLGSLIAVARVAKQISDPTTTLNRQLVVRSLMAGFLVGIATYMRPTWLLIGPGVSVLLILLGRGNLRIRFASAILVCVGMTLCLAPWTIRNTVVTEHVIPTTLWVGPSLYDGLNPTATGTSDMRFFDTEQLMSRMSEYEMDHEYRRRAWSWAAANPAKTAWLAGVKQWHYWSPSTDSEQFNSLMLRIVAWVAYLPLVGLALIGAWFARNNWWLLIITGAPILYFATLHILFVGSLRYRLPAEYPLAVLSAVGLVHLLPQPRRQDDLPI